MSQVQNTEPANRPLFGMFNAIPKRYDLVNRLITVGLDRKWRDEAAKECLASAPRRVLDLGCGTGDLAITIVKRARTYVNVTGFDYSPAMLEIAEAKAEAAVGRDRIAFTRGEAASLPFPNDYFDCVTTSFAFRNLTYKNPLMEFHLAEVFRVLAPGGRFVIVESSQPESRFIRGMFHLFLRTYVYGLGWALSGNRAAYKYLSESAARFYQPEDVKEILKTAGFRDVKYRPLMLGASGLTVAVK